MMLKSEEDASCFEAGTDFLRNAATLNPFRTSIERPGLGTEEDPIDLDYSDMRSEISDGDTTIPFTDCRADAESFSSNSVAVSDHGPRESLHEPRQHKASTMCPELMETTQLPRVANIPVYYSVPITTVDAGTQTVEDYHTSWCNRSHIDSASRTRRKRERPRRLRRSKRLSKKRRVQGN
ncbi:hypothetical protein BJX96DRAFT_157096 [Aspergillus floccosus]